MQDLISKVYRFFVLDKQTHTQIVIDKKEKLYFEILKGYSDLSFDDKRLFLYYFYNKYGLNTVDVYDLLLTGAMVV